MQNNSSRNFVFKITRPLSRLTPNKFLGSVFDGGAVSLTFGSLRVPLEKTDERPIHAQQPLIQVTHRLALSPMAAIELINGLNATLTALGKPRHRRSVQQPGPLNRVSKALEGIVSNRLSSRYTSGRCRDWLKFKNPNAPAVKRETEEDWN